MADVKVKVGRNSESPWLRIVICHHCYTFHGYDTLSEAVDAAIAHVNNGCVRQPPSSLRRDSIDLIATRSLMRKRPHA